MTKLIPADPYSETDRPRDLDELVHRLNRRLANHVEQWRRCRAVACRRTHRCLSRVLKCAIRKGPGTEMTEQQRAQMMVQLKRGIRQRLDELEAYPELQNVEEDEERRSAQNRSKTGRSGRSAHRKKAGGAP